MITIDSLKQSPAARKHVIAGLRISLGLVFFWFGALKVAGYNPVYEIVNASFPILATHFGNIALGLLETAIGLALLLKLAPKIVHPILFLHMMGTLSVLVQAPGLMFAPTFPILTLAGEFVFKNIVLATSGLAILFFEDARS